MKRMACVLAIAAGTGFGLNGAVNPAMAEPVSATSASGLQIAIGAAGMDEGSTAVTLDVNFHGGNIRRIELYVDGDLIKRQSLRTHSGRGVISFALDDSLIPVGDHDILIKAFDADENCATATRTVHIAASAPGALARFVGLKNHADVMGVVPVQIKLDASIRSPYVTFLVDNEFKAMVNYAPFTFNWDTTRLTNGTHKIGIEVVDGESLATVQTLNLQLNIVNVLGFTSRNGEVKDLATRRDGPGTGMSDAIRDAALSMVPDGRLEATEVARRSVQSHFDFLLPRAKQFAHTPGGRYVPTAVGRSVSPDARVNPVRGTNVIQTPMVSEGLAKLGLTHPDLDVFRTAFGGDRMQMDLRSISPMSAGVTRSPFELRNNAIHAVLPIRMSVPASIAGTTTPELTSAFADPNLNSLQSLPDAIQAASGLRSQDPASELAHMADAASVHSNAPAEIAIASPDRMPNANASHARPPAFVPQALMALLSDPVDSTPLAIDAMSGRLARQTARVRRPGSIAHRPLLNYTPSQLTSRPASVPRRASDDAAPSREIRHTQPILRVVAKSSMGTRIARALGSGEQVNIRVKSFDVAFDNTRIAFDVQPRVEHGLPLAPFRQIFEHTGGEVRWYGKSQTVRAVNSTHEIQFRIGHSVARVNNQPVKMDAKPFVEHGRAIVPLSFVRDAMDVKVNFDAHTGHLRIESNR